MVCAHPAFRENAPYINIRYEINSDIVEEVKRRNLDKNIYEDYLEIQNSGLAKKWFVMRTQ